MSRAIGWIVSMKTSLLSFVVACMLSGCLSSSTPRIVVPGIRAGESLVDRDDFELAFAWRWPAEHLDYVCRHTTPAVHRKGYQAEVPEAGDWVGVINPKRRRRAMYYHVRVGEAGPVSFRLWVSDGKRGWMLEEGPVSILREDRVIDHY